MSAQALITDGLVLCAALYAAWTLMPAVWRSALARRLGLQAGEADGCGSGCGGCASAASHKPACPPAPAVVTVHRRLPRSPAARPPR